MKAKKIPQVGNLVRLYNVINDFMGMFNVSFPQGQPYLGIVVDKEIDSNCKTIVQVYILSERRDNHHHIWNSLYDEVLS